MHFVEVKTRTQEFFGTPMEAITPNKLKQIFSCAIQYVSRTKKRYEKYQIDAIGILLYNKEVKKIEFIENISI